MSLFFLLLIFLLDALGFPVVRKSFEVDATTGGSVSVSGCSFKWTKTVSGSAANWIVRTREPVAPDAVSFDQAAELLQADVNKFAPQCVESTSEDRVFKFKLCVGALVVQSLVAGGTDKWTLGSFQASSWRKADDGSLSLSLKGGDKCVPSWPNMERALLLRVRCGPTVSLSLVKETSVCQYEGVIELPAACSERVKPYISTAVTNVATAAAKRWDEASWSIEMSRSLDGRVFCAARNTYAGSELVHISDFELTITDDEIDRTSCRSLVQGIDKTLSQADGATASATNKPIDSVRISCATDVLAV
jgi:hypothetical protein